MVQIDGRQRARNDQQLDYLWLSIHQVGPEMLIGRLVYILLGLGKQVEMAASG